MVRTCAEIVTELVAASEAGKDINLNGLKSRISRKHKLSSQPKLVEIIAAIPEQHKAALLPKLKAKPVRTASGVLYSLEMIKITIVY
jgi:elongator complex protein 3